MFGFGRERLTTAQVGNMLTSIVVSTGSEEHRRLRKRDEQTAEEERAETREYCLLSAFAIDYAVVLSVKDLAIRESIREHFYIGINGAMSWLTAPEMFYDVFCDRAARYGPAVNAQNDQDPGHHLWRLGKVFSESITGGAAQFGHSVVAAHFYVPSKKNALELLESIQKCKIVTVKVQ